MPRNIITISREFGSGGRYIGQCVAKRLGMAFYDRELITQVAQKSGLDMHFVEETGEYATTDSLLYGLAMSSISPLHSNYSESSVSLENKVHIFQAKVIQEAAEKGPCVIVGRCADYILRSRDDCLHVLIHADVQHKRQRAIQYLGIDEKHVDKKMRQIDKARANHYTQYTGKTWGNNKNYHISLNSGFFGLEKSIEIICDAFKE